MIQKVVPQASGESSKVKVKVRVNIHGVFSVSSASLVEVQKSAEVEEPMETEQAVKEDEVRPLFRYVLKAHSSTALVKFRRPALKVEWASDSGSRFLKKIMSHCGLL